MSYIRRLLCENSRDPACGICRWLVLPHPNHGPSRVVQLGIVEPVTLYVSSDLRAPVGGVGSRARSVLWTPVPEAAVHEHGNLLAAKDDVRPTSQSLHWRCVNAIAEAPPMKLRAQGKLRTSVALAVALHRCSDGGRGGRRGFWDDSRRPVAARSIGGSF